MQKPFSLPRRAATMADMNEDSPSAVNDVTRPSSWVRLLLQPCVFLVGALSIVLLWQISTDAYRISTEASVNLQRQHEICEQIISELGGLEVLWEDPEHRPNCGSYPVPEGLEFIVKTRTGGWAGGFVPIHVFAVTEVVTSQPSRQDLLKDKAKWKAVVLRKIGKLTTVRTLWLGDSFFSNDELAQLQQALPDCTFRYGHSYW